MQQEFLTLKIEWSLKMDSKFIGFDFNYFGYNARTGLLLGLTFFALWGTRSLRAQYLRLRSNPSAKGRVVATSRFIWMIWFFGSALLYGISVRDEGLVINALPRLPFMAMIVATLYKQKGFSHLEWLTFGGWGLIASGIVVFSEYRQLLLVIASTGGVFYASMQVVELWKVRERGVVHPEFFITTTFSGMFMTAYGMVVNDLAIVWSALPLTIVNATSLISWFILPQKTVLNR